MDPQARRFLAMVAVGAQPEAGADIEARRRSFEQLMRFSRKPEEPVDTEDGVIACRGRAIPFRVYTTPASATPSPGLVYFHGGGLVAGGLESHDNLCRRLAVGASCRLIAVDYRLAPEHPFPAAIVDALAAVRHVSRHPGRFGLAPERIAVGGDSGGATLATIVAGLLRRRRTIVAQLLLCRCSNSPRPHHPDAPSARASFSMRRRWFRTSSIMRRVESTPIQGSRRCASQTSSECRPR